AEEMFRYSKVINEYEFPPLKVLHYLLITLRLGRHFKGEFRLTKRGAELAQAPARLFAELVSFFVLRIDHASYARFEERPSKMKCCPNAGARKITREEHEDARQVARDIAKTDQYAIAMRLRKK